MKKNLIVALALVFVLGIAGTAFAAANPFVDVPAKHWAYDAVSKLAKAGILDGYGDGTYRGERLASRYEMAQATAKAMARADKADAQMKALIDKLAVEFAAELNNLGVRVAKLEKNASTIKFWGDSRLFYKSNAAGTPDELDKKAASDWNQRLRVYAKADVNDKASFFGRLQANWNDKAAADGNTSTDVFWDYGYFQWTFEPGFKVAIGRQQVIAAQDLFWTNGGYDAVQVMFGAPSDKFSGKIGYGDVGNYAGDAVTTKSDGSGKINKPLFLLDANYKFNKDITGNFAMYWSTDADNAALAADGTYTLGFPFQIYNLGFNAQLNQDFALKANYFWNDAKKVRDLTTDSHNGLMAALSYKGAQAAKVGTWGLLVSYRDIKPWAIDLGNVSGLMGNSMTDKSTMALGQKGWGLQGNYTISKNAVLTATYEQLNYNSAAATTKLLPFYYVQLNVSF